MYPVSHVATREDAPDGRHGVGASSGEVKKVTVGADRFRPSLRPRPLRGRIDGLPRRVRSMRSIGIA